MMTDKSNFVEATAGIVAAYIRTNQIDAGDVPSVIRQVHKALKHAVNGGPTTKVEFMRPAVPIKKSITPDYIICLEDGLKFKSMRRHLHTAYGLTPAAYRTKWGLPDDYPVVAPNYSAARSELAKGTGLGRQIKRPTVSKTSAPRTRR